MTYAATDLQLRLRSRVARRASEAEGTRWRSRIGTNPTWDQTLVEVEGCKGTARNRSRTPTRKKAAPTFLNRQPKQAANGLLKLYLKQSVALQSGGR
jgi:hypothetical protein